MANNDPASGEQLDEKTNELKEAIREIRDRVRRRYPRSEETAGEAPLADLMPLVTARDAAEAKVAAIGTVNPRKPGLVSNLIQAWKRLVARALDWHVREQVEFNRATIACVNAAIEALNETNRALEELARRDAQMQAIEDLRSGWEAWRPAWEAKLADTETRALRGLAEMENANQQRAVEMEASFRELVKAQEASFHQLVSSQNEEFHSDVDQSIDQLQQKLWEDMARLKTEYEQLLHNELRVLRQRVQAASQIAPSTAHAPAAASSAAAQPRVPIDHLRFSDRFRGTEERIREAQRYYLDYFRDCRSVLDIACGRGEFLDLLKESGIGARGVDSNPELAAICRSKGHEASESDLFDYLAAQEDGAFDGVFCSQLVEHLPPERVPELVELAAAKLTVGGRIALETPNPECLAIFATHFYLDPTHTRPVPPALLAFYLEEAGFGSIQVHRLSPAVDEIPALESLPDQVRDALFGSLDYGITARKL